MSTDVRQSSENLTGVWHGFYGYGYGVPMPDNPFTAVILDTGGRLSGTVHEIMMHYQGDPTEETALLEGAVTGEAVNFVKTYEGHGSQTHDVDYQGTLSADRDEIEGRWTILIATTKFSGRFLMIRKRGQGSAARVLAAVEA